MDKEFYKRKIQDLTDSELIDLLRKTSNEQNTEIFNLAKKEAELRNLDFPLNLTTKEQHVDSNADDLGNLEKWNWGAFLLGPIWTMANKLENWTILYFIPGVNVLVLFYLGKNGNRLSFENGTNDSVDDFIAIQKAWKRWGILFISVLTVVRIASSFID